MNDARICFQCRKRTLLMPRHNVCDACHASVGQCGRCGFVRQIPVSTIVEIPVRVYTRKAA